MKTHFLSKVGLAWLGLAASNSVFTLPAADGSLQPPAASTAAVPRGYDLQIVDGQLLRPGGPVEASLANVIDALREHYPEANIAMSPGLAKLTVGDLKLRAGSLAEELEAVRVASGERIDIQAPKPVASAVDPNTGLPLRDTRNANSGLFVVHESSFPGNRRTVEAFNIAPYLEWLRHQPKEPAAASRQESDGPEQVQKIISDTLDSLSAESGRVDSPSFQFHPGASVLVVIGTPESVEVARKIINVLPGMSSVATPVQGRYGSEPPGERNAREKAEDAFRARYGLAPRAAAPAPQPSAPGSSPPQ